MSLKELKKIKSLYGEEFSHICHKQFQTILEEEGKLLEILQQLFATNSKTIRRRYRKNK